MIDKFLSRRKLLQSTTALLASAALPSKTLAEAAAGTDAVSGPLAAEYIDASVLQAEVGGTVITRESPNYETWRRGMVWSEVKPSRRPEAIVQVSSISDITAVIKYARAKGKRLITRAGGHNYGASFLRDDGILIDVSRLDDLDVDKARKLAVIGPGVFSGTLNSALDTGGLAFPTAYVGYVPLSGFLLGGGFGLNGRAWGPMSTFHIEAVDIITAEGQLRHASPTENPELYWAVRGGGPGLFGVVVRFYLKCFPRPPVIRNAQYFFRFTDFELAMEQLASFAPALDPSIDIICSASKAPPEFAHACAQSGCDQLVVIEANAFSQDPDHSKKLIAGISAQRLMRRAIHVEDRRETTFDGIYAEIDYVVPRARWLADNIWTDRTAEVTRALARWIPSCPSQTAAVFLAFRGDHKLPDAAYSVFGKWYVDYIHLWEDPQKDLAMREYLLNVFQEIKGFSNGSYINEFNHEGRPEDLRHCYSAAAWQKLAELRSKWDPTRVFHHFYGQPS